MNLKLFPLCLFAAAVSASSSGFAQRQTAVGPGIIPLSPTGVLNGVDMSASGTTGTLSVGTVGGPQTDIFTLNNPPLAGSVAVSTAASSQGNIQFNSSSTVFGAIGVTQPGGPFLLDIAGGNAGTAVNFQGPVFATTTNVTGTGTLNFNSGNTNITATNFAADGFINLAPNTTVIGALTTTAGAQTGTLGLGGGSVLNGAVGGAVGLRSINVVGGNNIAGVAATITGAANAYAFSLGTNTLNVGGALTIANGGAGGVINTTLASPSVFGNIRPIGRTNIGPTLQINVTVPSNALIPLGTQFNIVQTRLGTVQSGTDGSVLHITVQDPTNPLYTFSAVPPAGTVAGLVAITTTGIPLIVPVAPPPGIVLPPTGPIAAPLVPVLIAAVTPPNPPGDLVQVLTAVNAIADSVTVVNAIAQLAPSTPDLVAPLVTFQGSRQFQNLWTSHLDDIMCSQASQPQDPSQVPQDATKCSGADPRGGAWVKGFGYFGDQGSQGPYPGYTSNIYGTMIGYDIPIDPATRVGLGLGYARSTIDGKLFSANTNFNTYQVTAYATHERGPWFVNGDVSFGWSDYNGTRNIMFPGVNLTAKGQYSGQDYTAFATTGYHFYTGGFTITPLASLQYTHVNLGSYSESGAGSVNLNVNSQSYDFLESRLGVKVARPIVVNPGTIVPQVHFNWYYELANPTLANTAAFSAAGSLPFTTPGLKTANSTLNGGIGFTFLSCACTGRTWSVEGVYDYYWRNDNYKAQQAMLRFTTRF
jgi:outer membrane autotransporter protein